MKTTYEIEISKGNDDWTLWEKTNNNVPDEEYLIKELGLAQIFDDPAITDIRSVKLEIERTTMMQVRHN